jgi:E3 ubiquitin-protein ligase SHPRH
MINLFILFYFILFHRVKSIAGLKFTIQFDIDSLQNARQQLMDRLLEVDNTMDNPRDEDIEGQRYCPKCYDGSGSLCIQCELDELFQVVTHHCFLKYLCPCEISHVLI